MRPADFLSEPHQSRYRIVGCGELANRISRDRCSSFVTASGLALLVLSCQVQADAAAEMAKKMQDPLANISAVMTDNDILFKTGDDDTSYSFQLQPVKAWSFDDHGFNFIARGVLPILGMAPESQKPNLGEPLPKGGGHT